MFYPFDSEWSLDSRGVDRPAGRAQAGAVPSRWSNRGLGRGTTGWSGTEERETRAYLRRTCGLDKERAATDILLACPWRVRHDVSGERVLRAGDHFAEAKMQLRGTCSPGFYVTSYTTSQKLAVSTSQKVASRVRRG